MARGAEVVVVGGGIIGAATAHLLAEQGVDVALVERGELAAGASGRNHGLLLTPLDPALEPMGAHSMALYRKTAPSCPLPVSIDAGPIGFLIVAVEESERAAAEAEAAAAERAGVAVDRLDGRALAELEPTLASDLPAGWFLNDGARVDPAALTVGLALLAGTRGARIHRHLTARTLLRRDGHVVGVATDEGIVEAKQVVVAAGPWSPSLLRPVGLNLPIMGARGWLVHLGAVADTPTHLVGRAGWHTLPHSDPLPPMEAASLAEGGLTPVVGSLIQPNADGTVLLGGSRQAAVTMEPEDPAVPAEIVRQALRLVPALSRARILSAWWGLRPMTPDGRPIVDRVGEGLVVAAGHGSLGVILGGGTAALVASMVTGTAPPFDPEPFRLSRFRNIGV